MFARAVALIIGMAVSIHAGAQTPPAPLVLEAKIPLGQVSGRIDHLAIDLKRQRLFVAELGNDSLGVVDHAAQRVLRTITGLSEPQGVGYEPTTDTMYVANANDGSVRVLRGDDLSPAGRIDLGEDADNVRIDAAQNRVLVGYGKGAIAVIDPMKRAKATEFRLHGHPEGFQTDADGTQLYVNVPDAREIAVVDCPNATVRSVATDGFRGNFPMAVDVQAKRILVVFRNPPTLAALASPGWGVVAKTETCGDADDVFVDPKRHRIYVSCGAGFVDVFELRGDTYARLGKVPTVSGARTALFAPELDRLFVAVRASGGEPAAIWVFRPIP
jgi:YVTN family beta-propeller protein